MKQHSHNKPISPPEWEIGLSPRQHALGQELAQVEQHPIEYDLIIPVEKKTLIQILNQNSLQLK